ncbi:MAG: Hsp70 family protein [Syntrophobacterales bacterium]|nr:Hsp70 family protein [Syntrophobacterales bacterium]
MIITRAIGIDLGTTNSAVSMLELNERDLLLCKDAQSRTTIPSCVWQNHRTGEIVVGHRAYVRKGTIPEPISSIKRSMGTQMSVSLGGEEHTPAEISAYILRELKKQIDTELESRSTDGLKYEVSHAIITVPAYFGLPAIEATREAGKLSGLEVTELLHEPTAAAIYYSWKYNLGDGVYMVYDLGGGTFDVSILRKTSGEFLVLGISGDNFLGGDDFDRRLAEHLRKLLVMDGYDMALDVTGDSEDILRFNQLVALAERTKKELSTKEEIVLRNQGTIKDKNGVPVIVEASISRSDFESMIEDILERTIECSKEALAKAHEKGGINLEDIDHILLVGGSTYVPSVMEKVRQTFCLNNDNGHEVRTVNVEPVRDDPENAIAFGAALRAASSGLGICDDKKLIRMWFRSGGATKQEQITISGHIEVLVQDMNLDNGRIRLIYSDETLDEVPLKQGLKFAFSRVSLTPESLNEFCFEVLGHTGEQSVAIKRSIMQASDQKEAVGNTLSTSVLPKPIVLEGTDGDRLVRRVLLVEGTSLPAIARFTFAINDLSGHIRLPIYQENRIIKELCAEVGEVAPGAPVEIEIACDEQVNIQVKFSMGEQSFGGKIAPPPPDTVPTEYEIQQIQQQFNLALKSLDEDDAIRLSNKYKTTYQDLIEAITGADYPKVIQRTRDLEGLVREVRLAEPLRPALTSIEEKYASCLTLIAKAKELKSEFVSSSLKEDLEKAMEKGKDAYQKRDKETYEETVQVISTSMQFLINITKVRDVENENVDSVMRALALIDECRQMLQFLLINCLFFDEEGYMDDLKKQIKELDELEEQANDEPTRIGNRCQVLITEASRIYKQIVPDDSPNDLDGLLKMDLHKHSPEVRARDDLFG